MHIYNLDTEQCIETGLFFGVTLGMTALTVILGILSTIFIIATAILARDRARPFKELQSARENIQRDSAAYEDLTLTPLGIDTSKNIAYRHPVTVSSI